MVKRSQLAAYVAQDVWPTCETVLITGAQMGTIRRDSNGNKGIKPSVSIDEA